MNQRYCIRLFRIYIILLIICIICLWLIPSNRFYSNEKNLVEIINYDDILDNHLYPPPSYSLNWSINDYFIRKDKYKTIEDQDAFEKKEKVSFEFISQKKSNYIILEYTNVFDRPKFCGKTQEFIFGKKCPYKNCRYTCDRNLTQYADVWLMHQSDIQFDKLPKERNTEQIWLFWHDEPLGVRKEAIPFQFNWTISYRFNAEANIGAYGLTILRERFLSQNEFDTYVNKQFYSRESNAVWFVSNCQPQARLNYYKELVLYYPSIRVYGNCVQRNKTNQCQRRSQCEITELSTNKFYLAFESQSCRDYVTEKFWRSVALGTIPIVFGPRDKRSLERIAPPNSFIYTGDFQSVSDLAEHLNEIGRNRTLFSKYHRWRRFYEVLYRPEDIEHYRFCELCYRLNTNQKKIYYQDLNKFFLEDC